MAESESKVTLSSKAKVFDRFDQTSYTNSKYVIDGKSRRNDVISESKLNWNQKVQIDATFLLHIIALVLTIIALIFAILAQLHDEQWNYYLETSQILAKDHELHRIFYPSVWRLELERHSITLIFGIVFIALLALLYTFHMGFYAVHNKFIDRMYYRIYPTLYLHAFFIILAVTSIILLIVSTYLASMRLLEINAQVNEWYQNMPKILRRYSHFFLYPPHQTVFYYCYYEWKMDNNYAFQLEKLVCPQDDYKLVSEILLGIVIMLFLAILFITLKLKAKVTNHIQPTETIYHLTTTTTFDQLPTPSTSQSVIKEDSNKNNLKNDLLLNNYNKLPITQKSEGKEKIQRPEGRVDFFDFGPPGAGPIQKKDYTERTEERVKKLVGEEQKKIQKNDEEKKRSLS